MTAKVLLGLIALALWANLGLTVFRPMVAVPDYRAALGSIDTNVGRISRGNCSNSKIC